jgi:hypothetical protein
MTAVPRIVRLRDRGDAGTDVVDRGLVARPSARRCDQSPAPSQRRFTQARA